MKTVFEGRIVNVIPVENGLIIAYACLEEDERATLAYKMITFEDGKLTNVPKSLYHISKFGTNYAMIEQRLKSPIKCKAVILPNNKVFTLDEGGAAMLHDTTGEVLWQGKIEYRGNTPSGIAISNRSVWTCFKENNVLIRMNLLTMKEELRIGGGKASPFVEPIDLFIDNGDIYVCLGKENKIVRVNTNTYVTEVYREFESPVIQYIKNGGYDFAVLDSGVYLLD